jgi:hypothetical protein
VCLRLERLGLRSHNGLLSVDQRLQPLENPPQLRSPDRRPALVLDEQALHGRRIVGREQRRDVGERELEAAQRADPFGTADLRGAVRAVARVRIDAGQPPAASSS